jgi:diacylglycerol kinase family enzyme
MKIAPGAELDDGMLDICAVRQLGRWSVLRILPKVLKGSHTTHPAVTMLQSKRIEIETPEGPRFICADGETLGQTPCVFEVRPGALKILTP